MTSSNGNIFRVTGHLCGEFTGHRWIPHTKASDAELWCFFMICIWVNSGINNREASDLRRYRARYDVIVMGLRNFILAFVCNSLYGEGNLHRIIACDMTRNINQEDTQQKSPHWRFVMWPHKSFFWKYSLIFIRITCACQSWKECLIN